MDKWHDVLIGMNVEPFHGRLTGEQVVVGMNAASANAAALLEDAKLLLANGRYARAVALAVLAVEEDGKRDLIRVLSVASDADIKKLWTAVGNHHVKNVSWIFPLLVDQGVATLDELAAAVFSQDSSHSRTLDRLKQLSLYTDCIANGSWSEPHATIREGVARALVDLATRHIQRPPASAAEVELARQMIGDKLPTTYGELKERLRGVVHDAKDRGETFEGVDTEKFLADHEPLSDDTQKAGNSS